MALTESKHLVSVTHIADSNTFDVKWENKVFRDGEEISSIPHRCAYMQEHKDNFIADLGSDAAQYITLAGW